MYSSACPDQLSSYNGKAVNTDALGNVTAYDGATYAWEGGHQLKSFTKGGKTTNYTYNDNGIRTGKTVDGVAETYDLRDGKVVTVYGGTSGSRMFNYDESGNLISMFYDQEYFYVRNLQGDVVGLLDNTGAFVVQYQYDIWGGLVGITGSKASTAGIANPFRYRSYFYDTESGLYYLQSRYYSPEWGRFLSTDEFGIQQMSVGTLGGANLFAYCGNNPVMLTDDNGHFGTPIQWACAAIGGVLGWFFGDSIARNMGLVPSGKGFWNATQYWAVRGAVVVGGAAIGYLIGTAIIQLVASFVQANPTVIITLVQRLGLSTTTAIMKAFGLNFMSSMSAGFLVSFASNFLSNPSQRLPLDFVQLLYDACKRLGIQVVVDSGHSGTAWNSFHMHIGSSRIHIAIVREAYDWLLRMIR